MGGATVGSEDRDDSRVRKLFRSRMLRWEGTRTRERRAGEQSEEGERGQRRPRPPSIHRTRSGLTSRVPHRPSRVGLRVVTAESESLRPCPTIGTSSRESTRSASARRRLAGSPSCARRRVATVWLFQKQAGRKNLFTLNPAGVSFSASLQLASPRPPAAERRTSRGPSSPPPPTTAPPLTCQT